MSAHSLPDPELFDLQDRPVCGRDLMLLRQWTGLSIADCCYLLGITVPRWHAYHKHPDQLLGDPSVALLAWALLRYPDVHYLPTFPDPAEVYPAYAHALEHSATTLPKPETAFSLLLGRERAATPRWLSEIGAPSQTLHPPVRRLLLAFQRLLTVQGVPGFEAFVNRARFEAQVRGLDLDAPSMTTWTHRTARSPDAPRRGRPPKSPSTPHAPIKRTVKQPSQATKQRKSSRN